jgi:hypothetical protein
LQALYIREEQVHSRRHKTTALVLNVDRFDIADGTAWVSNDLRHLVAVVQLQILDFALEDNSKIDPLFIAELAFDGKGLDSGENCKENHKNFRSVDKETDKNLLLSQLVTHFCSKIFISFIVANTQAQIDRLGQENNYE